MNSNRFRSYLALIVIFVLQPFFLSCEEKPGDENGNFDVSFSVPESVELEEGETSLSFRIMFGKSPLQTDIVVLTDTKGTGHDCPISVSRRGILPSRCSTGIFRIYTR